MMLNECHNNTSVSDCSGQQVRVLGRGWGYVGRMRFMCVHLGVGGSRREAAPSGPSPLSSLLMSPLETHPIPLIVMPWKRGEQCNL